MERKEFLQMCLEASKLPEWMLHMRRDVPEDLLVEYDEIIYYPVTFFYHFKNGVPEDGAVLHSLKANGIITADLSKVKKYRRAGLTV